MDIAVEGDAQSAPSCEQVNVDLSQPKDALESLASIDLIDLCNEAKIEHCRAVRDLSSCGRYVQHVLASCGHASLCIECSQRCEACPICRSPLPNTGSRIRLRLYNKCVEAGLISRRHEDEFREKKHARRLSMANVERLYHLFDVALANNLASLVCHYVTDVCMDESAVSSDPLIAFLLDEVVVEDWCRQKFKSIVTNLSEIYALNIEGMEAKLGTILKFGSQLTGLYNVLEVVESSSSQGFSDQASGLHQILDNIMKTKQHLEVMTWCVRHRYLEHIQSRFPDSISWSIQVHERKTAAMNRAWPDYSGNTSETSGSTLFIEDALSNLGIEHDSENAVEDLGISCLQEDKSASTIYNSHGEAMPGLYPFKSLRAAADILFLCGTSDMIVAKHAIFLYYLFDRHWTLPDMEWRCIIDDFATSFALDNRSVSESLSFYLLDDCADEALKAVGDILPKIAGPEMHPKVPRVLLQRARPDTALMVLRCSGHDGFSGYVHSKKDSIQLVCLDEAVTAVRVRVECGLLTEAFMYQRMHCSKAKEEMTKHDLDYQVHAWIHRVDVLVTELCLLCIRRNFVDRMIELPWNSDEEKYLCKCLYDNACQNPSSTCGSLLVVFYLQRYRYIEAFQADRKIRALEDRYSDTAEASSRVRLASQWRTNLVDKSIELLPEMQRMQLKTGKLDDLAFLTSKDSRVLSNNDTFGEASPSFSTAQQDQSTRSALVLQPDISSLLPNKPMSKVINQTSPIRSMNIMYDNHTSPFIFDEIARKSPLTARTSARANGHLHSRLRNGHKLSSNGTPVKEVRPWEDSFHLFSGQKTTSEEKASFGVPLILDDAVINSSMRKNGSPSQLTTKGSRWRSDEMSDDDAEMCPGTFFGRDGPILFGQNQYRT